MLKLPRTKDELQANKTESVPLGQCSGMTPDGAAGQLSPVMASPISLTPMIRQRTAMMAALF
jgi:hypothetical protein